MYEGFKNMSSDKINEEALSSQEVTDAVTEAVSEKTEKEKFHVDVKNIFVLLLDYWFIIFSYIITLFLLAEIDFFLASLTYLCPVIAIAPFYALGTIFLYFLVGLYPEDYDTVSVKESRRLVFITFISVIGFSIILNKVSPEPYPHLFFVLGGMIQFILSMSIRFFKRLITPSGKSKKSNS